MIFEFPMDHFPQQKKAIQSTEDRPQLRHNILRRAGCHLFTASCVELSRAVAEQKEQDARPRINSFFMMEGSPLATQVAPVVKMAIVRSQSVPAVPRDRVNSRAERIHKSILAFGRRVSTLLSMPVVTA